MTNPTTPDPQASGADAPDDLVELLADDGSVIGTFPRTAVHTQATALHRAFSSHLFDDQGRVLLTRRALTKTAWPGVWTNTCCGHPRPGEATQAAAERRIGEELGLAVGDLRVALPDYRYRAVDVSGIVENEICPVLLGRVDAAELAPHPEEVCDVVWLPWRDAVDLAHRAPKLLSPWAAEQLVLLATTPDIKEFA